MPPSMACRQEPRQGQMRESGLNAEPGAGAGLLLANYVGAAVLALRWQRAFNVPVMLGAHGLMAAFLLTNVSKLESARYSQKAIVTFYQSIWNL